jgi:ABC-type nitrate/sulfonate/bicarbonate transport system substrate-binding protein
MFRFRSSRPGPRATLARLCNSARNSGRNRFAFIATALIAVAALAAAGCSSSGSSSSSGSAAGSSSSAPIKISIALPATSIAQSLIFIAQDAGLFKKYGISANLIVADGGSAAQQLVIAGSAQFANGAVEPALVATTQGHPMLTPIAGYAGFNSSLVISKALADKAAQSGITVTSPVTDRFKILDGTTVASSDPTAPSAVALRDGLSQAGVTAKITYVGTTGMLTVFLRHDVDAAMEASPNTEAAVAQGGGVVWVNGPKDEFPGFGSNYFTAPLAVSASYYQSNPNAVIRTAAALIAASDMVKNDQPAAEAIVRKHFANLSDAIFDQMWQANEVAFTNPLPTTADIANIIKNYSGADAAQVKQLNPASILGADIQSKAEALVSQQS